MADFTTNCPHCGTALTAQDDWCGMSVECPSCKKVFTVPPAPSASASTSDSSSSSLSGDGGGTFTFVCPSCGTAAELPESLLGGEYECQVCFEKHPAAATTERQCPFCGGTVKYHAAICKFCKADLTRTPPESAPAKEETFLFICPECDAVAELPVSQKNQQYECKVCCETVIAVPAEERKCPHCGGKIKIRAAICKHCRKKITPLLPTQKPFTKTKTVTSGRRPAAVAPSGAVGGGFFELNRAAWNAISGQWAAFGIWMAAYIVWQLISIVLSRIPLAGGIFSYLLLPLGLGLPLCALRLVRQDNASFKSIFEPLQHYGHYLWGFLRFLLVCCLWMFLLVVPGIIALLRYSMTFFIMLDHPELSAKEAMEESDAITCGHKGRLFGYVFWIVVPNIICGVGFATSGIFQEHAKLISMILIGWGILYGIWLQFFLVAFYESIRRMEPAEPMLSRSASRRTGASVRTAKSRIISVIIILLTPSFICGITNVVYDNCEIYRYDHNTVRPFNDKIAAGRMKVSYVNCVIDNLASFFTGFFFIRCSPLYDLKNVDDYIEQKTLYRYGQSKAARQMTLKTIEIWEAAREQQERNKFYE